MPGVLAVGDSLTIGTTRDVGALRCRSYARWIAEATNQRVTIVAQRGGASDGVLDLYQRETPRGRFDLALILVGVNDVIRAGRMDADALGANVEALCMSVDADRAAVLTLYPNLGAVPTLWAYGPTRRRRIRQANRTIARAARNAAAELVVLPPLTGPLEIWADRIHPTAWGQVVIAREVVAQLGLDARIDASRPDADLRWRREYAWWTVKNVVRVPPLRAAGTVYRFVHPR